MELLRSHQSFVFNAFTSLKFFVSSTHSQRQSPRYLSINNRISFFITKCCVSEEEFPTPDSTSSTLNSPETFPIEKRRRSEISRQRRSKPEISKEEPPNFEIGWKRTKQISIEKPIGHVIADFLEKLEELMGREYGSRELLAKAGEIVAERAMEEAEILREEGKVEERMVRELERVLKLMEMDLIMVKAAVKEDTVQERLKQAKARCRQAILVAYSF